MKPRTLTPKLKNEIEELRKSRKSIDEYYFNFLSNFYDISKFVHLQIDKRIPKNMFAVAYRQYISFLISTWGTFFRDTFVFLCSKETNIENKFIKELNIKKTKINGLSRREIIELISKCYNFQNLQDINSAFSIILQEDFLVNMSEYKIPYGGISGKIAKDIQLKNLDKKWKDNLEKTFDIRHKIIHDANFRPKIDIKFIQNAEVLFLLIPQIFSIEISLKYSLKHIHLQTKDGQHGPAIFTVKDILSEDWEVL